MALICNDEGGAQEHPHPHPHPLGDMELADCKDSVLDVSSYPNHSISPTLPSSANMTSSGQNISRGNLHMVFVPTKSYQLAPKRKVLQLNCVHG